MKAMHPREKGFTLIELLVVIAIIGVLSSVVLASMNGARKKSRDARRKQDIKSFQVALELIYDASSPNAYPATVSGTEVVMSSTQISSTYMSRVAKDPSAPASPAATDRQYWYASTGSSYCIGAVMENVMPAIIDGCSGTPQTDVTDGLDAITGYSTTAGAATAYKVGQ
jgi:prepilin-type N-terminal cleavage/methylation domain-containing protein